MSHRKVLIIPDKFKGTLTAPEAARAIASGWLESRPLDEVESLPMSDGGDGFGEVIGGLAGAEPVEIATVDAAQRPRLATWWWDKANRRAIVETAQVVGLALLPPGQFHPFELDTFGLGAVLREAAARGAKTCLAGIGGSATNDGGFGLARALGWQFLCEDGRPIHVWTDLRRLRSIIPPAEPLGLESLTVASDVQNPLLGPLGASRIYGPQKGLRPEDFPLAEECLGRLADVARRDLGIAAETVPGTGAAGGLGFGLKVFLNGTFEPGASIFARLARLEERIKGADLVITAEGAFDQSSLMGKGAGSILRTCRSMGVPCLVLAGSVGPMPEAEMAGVHSVVPGLADAAHSKARPAHWLSRLAAEVALRAAPAAIGEQ